MSSLYRLDAPADRIAARFHADAGDDPWAGGDIAPGDFAPVILRRSGGARRIVPRLWGVPPPPGQAADGRPISHVRNLASPFWIGTLRHGEYRCLVPATAFPAGPAARDPATGIRVRPWFTLPATPLFAFAGIWRDSEVPSFAILSCEANRLVGASGAAAMPVILHAEDHERWLAADWGRAQALVAPFPSQLMTRMAAAPAAIFATGTPALPSGAASD